MNYRISRLAESKQMPINPAKLADEAAYRDGKVRAFRHRHSGAAEALIRIKAGHQNSQGYCSLDA